MIKQAMLNTDEESQETLIEIAKSLSVGKYTLDETLVAIERSKVAISLTYSVPI